MNPNLELSPIMVGFLASLLAGLCSGVGALPILVVRQISSQVQNAMLGFAAGVMLAASFWSLLAPAIEMSENLGQPGWLPPAIGFMLGGIFLRLVDKVLPHLHINAPINEAEGISTRWKKTTLLVLAITLHNIPEGLAIGVAFGAVAYDLPTATLGGAIALAIGIGIQNFPEGTAVSMPLRREGVSKGRSFWYGQLSGTVEPVAAVIGVLFVLVARPMLPYALSFAAGAMIFVVVEEVIPESQRGGNTDIATLGAMAGFTIMMVLDVALG
ncbi:MAG: ZIP family metal transporter [Thermodesulfovibrionales bacterium]|nr:ZIP family metal transporter [Thermodesulfovibrionales bacterium]